LTKILECFWCAIELKHDKEQNFYKCPNCGGEWWPAEPKIKENIDIVELWKDEQRYKKSISSPGGGNKRVGRKKESNKANSDKPWLHET
jgi:transcription elongation factor Elf1